MGTLKCRMHIEESGVWRLIGIETFGAMVRDLDCILRTLGATGRISEK